MRGRNDTEKEFALTKSPIILARLKEFLSLLNIAHGSLLGAKPQALEFANTFTSLCSELVIAGVLRSLRQGVPEGPWRTTLGIHREGHKKPLSIIISKASAENLRKPRAGAFRKRTSKVTQELPKASPSGNTKEPSAVNEHNYRGKNS